MDKPGGRVYHREVERALVAPAMMQWLLVAELTCVPLVCFSRTSQNSLSRVLALETVSGQLLVSGLLLLLLLGLLLLV